MKSVFGIPGFRRRAAVCALAVTLGVFLGGCKQPVSAPAQYTITFDSHGGTAAAAITADEGTAIPKPADPARAGYVFTGWYNTASGGLAYSWPHTLTGNVTMHAQWTASGYAITYHLDGGTNDSGNPAVYTTETALTLAAPTRLGYAFEGWYDNGTFTGNPVTEIPLGATGDKNFYAQWTASGYTITYHLNGGTNDSGNPAVYTVTELPVNLAAPTRLGYAFGGWYDNGTFTGTAITSIPANSTGDKSFYAKWTVSGYSITYHLNGGTNAGTNPAAYTVTELPVNLAAPTRLGYTFGGWYDNGAFTGTAVTSIPANSTGDKSFYAQWTVNNYTLSYTLNGGTNGANPAAYTVEELPLNLAAPTRLGYTFGGWYGNGTFTGTAITSIPANSTGDKSFYAKWTLTTYAITYHLNGGTNAGTNPAMYTIESGAITLADPSRTGYTFGGWYAESDFSGTAVTGIPANSTGNKSFYAQWTAVSYSITYNLDGGTNAGANPAAYTVEELPLTLAAPARTGYTFGGWYGNGTFTGTAITSIPANSTGDKSFYAQWTITNYAITYNLNGGTNAGTNPAMYTIESGAITLADPSRTGYTFGGWYAESDFSGTAVTGIPANSTGNKSFYAQWTAVSYSITYNLDGGTNDGANPAAYTVEELPVNLAAPSRTGFSFGGWYAESDFSGTAVTEIPAGSTGNKTFYAQWQSEVTVNISVWVNEDGNILVSGDDPVISKTSSGGNASTFTAEVTSAYSGVQWYLNGFPITGTQGTAQSITIKAADYSNGTYILGVTVAKDAVPYSTDIRFTVVN